MARGSGKSLLEKKEVRNHGFENKDALVNVKTCKQKHIYMLEGP